MKARGDEIWAQDEATSVIYGMPMAVVKAGIADNELALEDIGESLQKVMKWIC
jgi:two-component system chemotaxis response regulator CheB